MEYPLTKHEQLLSWMDTDSYDQLSWIYSYLAKKGLQELPGSQAKIAGDLYQLHKLFKFSLHHASTRELLRSMRAAWHQKQYRERNGRQVSFQLPERVLKELDQIARSRRQSKTQTLRQIIHDATKQNQRDRHRSKGKIEKLESNLKRLHEEKLKAEAIRNKIINSLSKELAKEILRSCHYAASFGPLESADLKDIKISQINELARERAVSVDTNLWQIKLIRSGIQPISHYLELSQGEAD